MTPHTPTPHPSLYFHYPINYRQKCFVILKEGIGPLCFGLWRWKPWLWMCKSFSLQPHNSTSSIRASLMSYLYCQVKSFIFLHSPGSRDYRCTVSNYMSRRICVLEGLSVNISSKNLGEMKGYNKSWYRSETRGEKNLLSLLEEDGRVEFDNSMENVHTLRINNVERNDSGHYVFKVKDFRNWWKKSEKSRVTLVVTGNSSFK